MPTEPTFPCNGHSELRQLSFFTSRDLVDERTASSEIGLKLYHARGLGAGRQHLIAEAPTWGYTRLRGALKNLGHELGRNTIKRILADHGIAPAPEQGKSMSRSTFIPSVPTYLRHFAP